MLKDPLKGVRQAMCGTDWEYGVVGKVHSMGKCFLTLPYGKGHFSFTGMKLLDYILWISLTLRKLSVGKFACGVKTWDA